LNHKQMSFVHDLVIWHKGRTCHLNRSAFRYISLKDVKDIIVNEMIDNVKVVQPLKLLHLNYIDADNASVNVTDYYTKPLELYNHMFCTLSNSSLSVDLNQFDIHPMSTATIIHHGMGEFNWELIQTCDI